MTVTLDTTGFGASVTVITERRDIDLCWLEQWVARREAALSRFDPASELSRLNARAGDWIEVSPLLFGVLERAVAIARATDGLVTPVVLNALLAAGYDRPFAAGLDGDATLAATPGPAPGADCVELDVSRRSVRVPPGVGLDLGGIAKGYLADALADELHLPSLVDLGGDVAVRGPRRDGTAWVVETEPDCSGATRLLLIERGGIATSGTERRRWMRGKRVQHHLIDPRTGGVAETDLLRTTVIAPTTWLAEVATKVAMLLGLDAAMQFVNGRSELAGLFVTEDGAEHPSTRLGWFAWEKHGQAS